VPEGESLVKELRTFNSKLSPSGDLMYAHPRSRDHDDLVLAVTIGLWFAQRQATEFRGIERVAEELIVTPGWQWPLVEHPGRHAADGSIVLPQHVGVAFPRREEIAF
jgi:hypothetical protein